MPEWLKGNDWKSFDGFKAHPRVRISYPLPNIMDRKTQVKICLDEIESALRHLEDKKASDEALSKYRGWIVRHKKMLKELKYRGKMPRKGRK